MHRFLDQTFLGDNASWVVKDALDVCLESLPCMLRRASWWEDLGGLHKDGSEGQIEQPRRSELSDFCSAGQSSRPWADSLVVQMDTFRKGKADHDTNM